MAHFTRADYQSQVTMAFKYLQNVVLSHSHGSHGKGHHAHNNKHNNNNGIGSEKRIRIFWRETTAQHFPTPNGYELSCFCYITLKLLFYPVKTNPRYFCLYKMHSPNVFFCYGRAISCRIYLISFCFSFMFESILFYDLSCGWLADCVTLEK